MHRIMLKFSDLVQQYNKKLLFQHKTGAPSYSASGFLVSFADELPLSAASVGQNVDHSLLFGTWNDMKREEVRQ